MRLEYLPYLRMKMLSLLQAAEGEQKENIDKVVDMLEEYGFSKDDFMDTMKELQFTIEKDPILVDKFEKIDSKVKAALTRAYNSREHTNPALIAAMAYSKKKGRAFAAGVNDDVSYIEYVRYMIYI
jgi:replication factor C subunit 1